MRLRQAVVDAVVSGREITASPRVSKDVMGAGHGNTNSSSSQAGWAVGGVLEVELLPVVHMALDSVPRATNGL